MTPTSDSRRQPQEIQGGHKLTRHCGQSNLQAHNPRGVKRAVPGVLHLEIRPQQQAIRETPEVEDGKILHMRQKCAGSGMLVGVIVSSTAVFPMSGVRR